MAAKQKTAADLCLTTTLATKATKTFAFSKSFMKAMLMTSFVNIAYQRIDIDQAEVSEKKFNEVTFLGLRKGIPKDRNLKMFLDLRSGIYDAVEKNYLKEVYLHIMGKDKKDVIESYIFKIKYNNPTAAKISNTVEHKESIINLLELFLELGKHEKLGRQCEIEVELAFYDITPRIYEPPGFDAAANPHCLKLDSGHHKLASINTGFHSMKCYGIGQIFTELFNESRTEASQALCFETADANQELTQPDEGEPKAKRSKADAPVAVEATENNIVPSEEDQNENEVTPTDKQISTVNECGAFDFLDEIVGRNKKNAGASNMNRSLMFDSFEKDVMTMNKLPEAPNANRSLMFDSFKKDVMTMNKTPEAPNANRMEELDICDEILSISDDGSPKMTGKETPNINVLSNVAIQNEVLSMADKTNITIEDDEFDWDDRSTARIENKCICELSDLPEYFPTFDCVNCNNLFHLPCCGYLLSPSEGEETRCSECHKTDSLMIGNHRDNQHWIAKFRLLTYVLYHKKTLDKNLFNKFSKPVQEYISETLTKYGVITIDKKTHKRVYDENEMPVVLRFLFPTADESQYLRV